MAENRSIESQGSLLASLLFPSLPRTRHGVTLHYLCQKEMLRSEEPIWKQLEPNWPIIVFVLLAFLLGKWGFSILVVPVLLFFLYDIIIHEALHLISALITPWRALEASFYRSCFARKDVPNHARTFSRSKLTT